MTRRDGQGSCQTDLALFVNRSLEVHRMPLPAFGIICARIALLAAVLLPLAAIGMPQETRYTTVELISENASVPVTGGTITVGLYLEPNPSWHAYWSNPGDAGKAPRITWSLPPGFDAGEFSFPSPVLLPFGDLTTYGYDEPILLLAEITVPEGLVAGETVEIGGKARWVVCDDSICVPDRANVSLQLAAGDGNLNPDQAARFDEARRKLPDPGAWPAGFSIADGEVSFDIAPADIRHDFDDAYLFVESTNLVHYGRQSVEVSASGLRFVMDAAAADGLDDATSAVLTYTRSDGQAASIALEFLQRPAATLSEALATGPESAMGLLRAIVFAAVGGIILNLMPCVFP
ncbi:MAG: protein-disulfide reductase DsbD family protein, partial [Gammaproteobacteria bacterium]|nr:protein-disulfide reductase DsbD family protein [Gammaproteobacteria bacterium]